MSNRGLLEAKRKMVEQTNDFEMAKKLPFLFR